jgi:hypothetical protein
MVFPWTDTWVQTVLQHDLAGTAKLADAPLFQQLQHAPGSLWSGLSGQEIEVFGEVDAAITAVFERADLLHPQKLVARVEDGVNGTPGGMEETHASISWALPSTESLAQGSRGEHTVLR